MSWKEVLLDLYLRRAEDIVLDVGTGFGENLALLRKAFPNSTIVSIDPNFSAGRYAKGLYFVQAKAERLPFRDESFDLLSSVTTMHHVKSIRAALEEFKRVLKCKGRLIIMDWTPDSKYNPHSKDTVAKSMNEVISSIDYYVQVIQLDEGDYFYTICGAKIC